METGNGDADREGHGIMTTEYIPEVIFYRHLGAYGYYVWEYTGCERVLRIASGAHFGNQMIAGLNGVIDADRLRKVLFKHRNEEIAA